MPCYQPIPARRSESGGPWTIQPQLGTADAFLPCGKCLGCRTTVQNSWVHRCVHEAQRSPYNTFVTLTYDDDHLPHELIPYHVTAFLKRLRKATGRNPNVLTQGNTGVRYLACGEYGDKTIRPHYHLNLFNCSFKDANTYSKKLQVSDTLDRIWGYGAAKLAPFTPATAGYVAGYITKHGHRDYYGEQGEILEPPFKRQSTKPAIGRRWIEQYAEDVQHGYLIHEGQKKIIPRYYSKILEKIAQQKYIGPKTLQEVKQHRANQTLGDKLDTQHEQIPQARLTAAQNIHLQHMQRKQRHGF